MHRGFHWSLRPEADGWRWRALAAEGDRIVIEGVARTRAEGAAYLARAMSLAVLEPEAGHAA